MKAILLGTLERINIDNPKRNTFGNLFLEYKPIDKLIFKTSYAINHSDEFYKEFDPRVAEASKLNKATNKLTQIQANEINWSWENTLNYTNTFNDAHAFQVVSTIIVTPSFDNGGLISGLIWLILRASLGLS